LTAGAMIGVIDTVLGEEILRVTGDEDIGFLRADDADNIAA